jgi:hypothetical protein
LAWTSAATDVSKDSFTVRVTGKLPSLAQSVGPSISSECGSLTLSGLKFPLLKTDFDTNACSCSVVVKSCRKSRVLP